jgi:hypothetical protein
MRKIDRAMCALFLLAVLADVAWAHASVPAGSEASLILSAASQLQAAPPAGAIQVLRRSGNSSAPPSSIRLATLDRCARRLSGWSSDLFDFSNPLIHSGASSAPDAEASLPLPSASEAASPRQAIFEHTGSPAP